MFIFSCKGRDNRTLSKTISKTWEKTIIIFFIIILFTFYLFIPQVSQHLIPTVSLLVGLFCLHSICVSCWQLGFWQMAPIFIKGKKNVLPLISVCTVCKVYLHCRHIDGDLLIMCSTKVCASNISCLTLFKASHEQSLQVAVIASLLAACTRARCARSAFRVPLIKWSIIVFSISPKSSHYHFNDITLLLICLPHSRWCNL